MYLLLKTISALPLGVLRYLAGLVAFLIIRLPNSSMARKVQVNLQLAYTQLNPAQHEQLINASIYSQCLTAVESVKCWGMPTSYSMAQIRQIYGMDILLTALQCPRGVIAVVPHLGTWELMNAWLNQYASPTIMYKPSKDAGVDRFMLEARQRLNATLVPTDERGVRAIFKALKQGGFTAILPDHVPDQSGGIYSPFFGQTVLTSTLVSKLAAKTQCEVIGLSCLRHADGQGFDVYCEKLDSAISSTDLQTSVDALNIEIERMINRAPEQYMWGYKRFKNIPSQQDLYRKVPN